MGEGRGEVGEESEGRGGEKRGEGEGRGKRREEEGRDGGKGVGESKDGVRPLKGRVTQAERTLFHDMTSHISKVACTVFP